MTEVVVFDTNVLPIRGGLDGPLWLSIRKIALARGVTLAIPELVVHESVNLRRTKYKDASEQFLEAYRAIEGYFDAPAVYVPDVEEICESWETELRANFRVIDLDGRDAVQALEREASRTRPARNGRGSRDSAVWLTVLRLATVNEHVIFVSGNTADFATGKDSALHPDLARDAASVSGEIAYLPALSLLIQRHSTPVESYSVPMPTVTQVLAFDFRDRVRAEMDADERFNGIAPSELRADAMELRDLLTRRAYIIEDLTLGLVEGLGQIPIGNVGDGVGVVFKFVAWVEVDAASGGPRGGEIHSLSLLLDPKEETPLSTLG